MFAARYGESDPYASCFAYSRARLEHWLNHGLPARGDGARLLDLGCGTGHQMASLRDRGFEVTGVDGSAEMLAHARANNPDAELHQADVGQLPLADESFDYVLSIEVLRYLSEPERCVAEIARVLRPGGVALATATPLLNLNGYALVNRVALALPVVAFRAACERERAEVVDQLLALVAEFEIPATWCVLGHLFLDACSPRNGVKHPEIVVSRRASGETG
jgi:ubiquinone/menaquinone biosynthesis C-methylase UbiE